MLVLLPKIINMSETFAQLLEESLKELNIRPGSLIRGVVTDIGRNVVIVDAGLKSESSIPIEQFKNSKGELEVSLHDEVDVVLDAVEGGFGETILSREKAKRHESWNALERSYEKGEIVTGLITGKVKGGFTVELNGIRAFLPGSLVEARPVRDASYLEGKELEFKVIKLDQKRNNVVVSRRAILESETNLERSQLLDTLQEGIVIRGIVKNLTDYGAFIDLGGIDGLLHITDMAWKRIKNPAECVTAGEEITVKVLKFDRERTRVSLGLKQLGEDPWIAIASRYPERTRLVGRVTNLTDYGCFVEIEEGVEGLVHVSEMDWTNKNVHPSKVVSVGDQVEVMVLDIDEERRRISLGLKQCRANPWDLFCEKYSKGDQIKGKIKSITDFGIFIGLDGGIDGLVHLSDISWNVSGEEVVSHFKKGDEITAVLLQVDLERERISLGIKQLADDPFNNYLASNKRGERVMGQVTAIDTTGVRLLLADGIHGRIPSSDINLEAVSEGQESSSFTPADGGEVYTLGSTIEAQIIGIDRKSRCVNLSLRFRDDLEEKASSSEPSGSEEKGTQKRNGVEETTFSNTMSEAFKAAKSNK